MPDNLAIPPVRKASTVILVRQGYPSFEAYLLKRNVKSGFMGGYHVFPGGTVDPEDIGINTWLPHIDLSLEQIDKQFGDERLSGENAVGFAIAAIRETLEESGVLLANGFNKTSMDCENMSIRRLGKSLPKTWFKDRIVNEDWKLSLSCLHRWSHWITPEEMKSRYDTRFFIARMPANQTCLPDNRETQQGLWLTPQAALEQNLNETIALSPPTVATLTQLVKFKTFEDLLQAFPNCQWGAPIMPRVILTEEGPIILEPWDPLYDSKTAVETQDLADKVLPPGEKFSRIWRDGHIWKPVAL